MIKLRSALILGVTLLTSTALVSCSYIPRPSFLKNRDKQYLKAGSIQPLRIPPGVASSSFQNYYPVGMRYYTEEQKDISLVPPGL